MNMSGSNQQMTAQQQNDTARALISALGLEMVQQIFSQTVVPSTQTQLNIPVRNVGLLRGFYVTVAAKMHATGGSAAISPFGAANLLSNISFYDLNNNLRHNTSGWHMALLTAVRKGKPYPGAFTPDLLNSPIGFGAGFTPLSVAIPSSLPTTAPTNPNVIMTYYVPIAYGKDDLRGSIYMGVTNATASLQLTLNTSALGASGSDPTLAVYTGGTGNSFDSATVTVYQDYIDQLPQANNGAPVLPLIDLSTVYELKQTSFSGMNVGQDFPMPYSNFRSFLSTFVVFDNGGSLNYGSDLAYFALQAANFTNMIKTGPDIWSLWAREALGSDLPAGTYYKDHRRKPLDTNQYGNLQLIANATTVNSNAQFLVGYEDFALINTVQLAGSLPGN
jgi:hypothetical protein